jgi:hemerythrin superfamily protein
MNAIQLILNQHARIRKFLAKLSKTKNPATSNTLFKKLAAFLISHETMEQKVWYPFLKKNNKLKPTITHLITEEKTAAKSITKIKKIKSQNTFEEKIMELMSAVSHHAKEEETKLLPKVRKLIEESELKKVGKQMQEFKKAFDIEHS